MKKNNAIGWSDARSGKIYFFLLTGILLLFFSCGGSRGTASSDEMQDFQNLSEMVSSRDFEIQNQWAMPIGGNMINLIGNPNSIKFEGDSVQIHLPYFGIRYSGGGYGSESGIKFNGIPQNLSVEEDESERNIIMEFEGQHENESLNFFITIYPSGTANTSVNTSQRSAISYRGDIKANLEQVSGK